MVLESGITAKVDTRGDCPSLRALTPWKQLRPPSTCPRLHPSCRSVFRTPVTSPSPPPPGLQSHSQQPERGKGLWVPVNESMSL